MLIRIRPRFAVTLLGFGALAGGLTPLAASGTYPPAPPQLRSDVVREIDPETYNLGKSIFTGRANLPPPAPGSDDGVGQRREHLNVVFAQLPERARAQVDAATLARELDDTAAAALVYYLRLRFHLLEGRS